MVTSPRWTRSEVLVALHLYCQLPFGRLHASNPVIVRFAEAMGRSPSALAMKLVNIASLDPKIASTGRSGLPNTSALDRVVWAEMQADWDQFAIQADQAVSEIGMAEEASDDQPEESRVGEDRPVEATTRIGQRFFRRTVLSSYAGRCCITGLSNPSLLIASHIIPWSHDKANRVNPRNGLLLSALHDKAFDSGIITITDDMTVRVSSEHLQGNDDFFSQAIGVYDGREIALPQKFEPSREFLRYHREHVFIG